MIDPGVELLYPPSLPPSQQTSQRRVLPDLEGSKFWRLAQNKAYFAVLAM